MKSYFLRTILTLLARTWRLRVKGKMPDAPCVVAFWHGEMLPVWWCFARKGKAIPAALVSASRDGGLLSDVLQHWKYRLVRGSSSRGGSAALDQLVVLATSNVVLITPDGPRGPANEFKPGAIIAASRAGVPLVLVRMHATRALTFHKSWDNFRLPLIGSRVVLTISDPFVMPDAADRTAVGAMMRRMAEELNSMGETDV